MIGHAGPGDDSRGIGKRRRVGMARLAAEGRGDSRRIATDPT